MARPGGRSLEVLVDGEPGAQVDLYPDEGHLSLAVASLERIVTELAGLGKPARATAS